MALIESTLQELAASFQLPALEFNRNGVAMLRLGERDTVSLEKQDNGVLLSVARQLPPHRPGIAEKALHLCDPASGAPVPMRAGLTKDNKLVFITRFGEREFTLTEAVRCITAMREALSRASEL